MAVIYFRAMGGRWIAKKVDTVAISAMDIEPKNVNESFWIVPGTVSVDE